MEELFDVTELDYEIKKDMQSYHSQTTTQYCSSVATLRRADKAMEPPVGEGYLLHRRQLTALIAVSSPRSKVKVPPYWPNHTPTHILGNCVEGRWGEQ